MSFTYLFYKDIILRKSCGKCPYANTSHPSDITIGDFWGWQKTNPEINKDNMGISLIMCNTEKGRKLFDLIKDDLDYFPAELENCIQPNLLRPTPINPQSVQFEREYAEKGFEYVYYKYGDEGLRYKLRKVWENILRFPIRIVRKMTYKISRV